MTPVSEDGRDAQVPGERQVAVAHQQVHDGQAEVLKSSQPCKIMMGKFYGEGRKRLEFRLRESQDQCLECSDIGKEQLR